jgi:hypothetical protein
VQVSAQQDVTIGAAWQVAQRGDGGAREPGVEASGVRSEVGLKLRGPAVADLLEGAERVTRRERAIPEPAQKAGDHDVLLALGERAADRRARAQRSSSSASLAPYARAA